MVDDISNFDDLEFEELFRAFDDVVAPADLKSKTLATIAAESAPAIEKTRLRPVVSLPQTQNLRAEHMRRRKRVLRPLHVAVGSALALVLVAVVGATCWFYPVTSVRVEQDEMVVDLGVNVFGACISASADGEQGEAVLSAEDIHNLPREEAEARLVKRFERMRRDGDFNGQNAGGAENAQVPSYSGEKNYGDSTGQSDQSMSTYNQETNQYVPNGEGNVPQPNNQQQQKPPVPDGQHQQGEVPPVGNPDQQGQNQQQGQPQPQPSDRQAQPQPNDQQQQQQNQQQDQQRQDQQRQDQGQNQRQPQPTDDRRDQSQSGQTNNDRSGRGDTSQGQDPSQQQTGGQPTGDDRGQQAPVDSGQGPERGNEGSTQGGSPDQQRTENAANTEPAQDMAGGEAQGGPSGFEQPSGVEPMAES